MEVTPKRPSERRREEAGGLPAHPARGPPARGRRAPRRRPPAHAGPAPRRGRAAGRRRDHLVHVARAGPRRARLARGARGASRGALRLTPRRARASDPARPRRAAQPCKSPVEEVSPMVRRLVENMGPNPTYLSAAAGTTSRGTDAFELVFGWETGRVDPRARNHVGWVHGPVLADAVLRRIGRRARAWSWPSSAPTAPGTSVTQIRGADLRAQPASPEFRKRGSATRSPAAETGARSSPTPRRERSCSTTRCSNTERARAAAGRLLTVVRARHPREAGELLEDREADSRDLTPATAAG